MHRLGGKRIEGVFCLRAIDGHDQDMAAPFGENSIHDGSPPRLLADTRYAVETHTGPPVVGGSFTNLAIPTRARRSISLDYVVSNIDSHALKLPFWGTSKWTGACAIGLAHYLSSQAFRLDRLWLANTTAMVETR